MALAFDGFATCDDSQRRWRLALINRHPNESLACNVMLDGQQLEGVHRVTQLCGDAPDACNDVDDPSRVVPKTAELTFEEGRALLPPHSLIALQIA